MLSYNHSYDNSGQTFGCQHKKNCLNLNQLHNDSADSSVMRDETVPKASGYDKSITNWWKIAYKYCGKITKSSCKCISVAENVKWGEKIKEMHKTWTVNQKQSLPRIPMIEWSNEWIMVIQHITSWNTGAPYLITALHLVDSCHVFAPPVLTGLSSQ